jgi:PIN domain nuclease of toxin-antitoxin system
LSDYVADTHALYWHLINDPSLSITARRLLTAADQRLNQVFVPGIALIELVYLTERGRAAPEALTELLARIDSPTIDYVLAGLDQETARAMHVVPRSAVPDMPDRIIVATALQLGLPLITRDGAIHRSGVVPVVW